MNARRVAAALAVVAVVRYAWQLHRSEVILAELQGYARGMYDGHRITVEGMGR